MLVVVVSKILAKHIVCFGLKLDVNLYLKTNHFHELTFYFLYMMFRLNIFLMYVNT